MHSILPMRQDDVFYITFIIVWIGRVHDRVNSLAKLLISFVVAGNHDNDFVPDVIPSYSSFASAEIDE